MTLASTVNLTYILIPKVIKFLVLKKKVFTTYGHGGQFGHGTGTI